MIGRHADMRYTMLQHSADGVDNPPHRTDFPVMFVPGRRQSEEMPEQFVGAIYKVDIHARSLRTDFEGQRVSDRGRPAAERNSGG